MTGELVPIVKAATESVRSGETGKPLREAVGSTLADVWQGIVGDRVAAWRMKNAAAISAKLTDKLARTGVKIDTARVSERYAFTWFEEASKQDQPEIQDLFATLLANAAGGNEEALEQRNLEIVSRMAPKDAQLLRIVLDKLERRGTLFGPEIVTFRWREARFLEIAKRDYGFDDYISVENLIRLGVVDRDLELDTAALEDHIDKVSAAIEMQSAADLPDLLWRDLVEVKHVLTLSLTGYSLARAISPESFPQMGEG